VFCREAIGELRRLHDEGTGSPRILFVHQGTARDAEPLFEALWPEARAVSDPDLALYRAFGIGRGNPSHLLRPGLWKAGRRARRRGYRQTGIQGDPWLLPGYFLVEDGWVVWSYHSAHAGDLPDLAARPWEGRS